MRRSITTVVAMGLCSVACEKGTSFGSQTEGRVSMSAEERIANSKAPEIGDVPEGALDACRARYQALRIAFVVDNSASNNGEPNKIQTDNVISGTDPIIGLGELVYTRRQKAIHRTLLHLAQMDQKLRAENDEFQGSAVGISYFPKDESIDGNGKYAMVSGEVGVLPDLMTETSAIGTDPDSSQALWDALKFTYTPRGMTPYKAALESAKKMLFDSRREEDTRPGLVMLLTDGLPSDDKLEPVRAVRRELGDTKIVLLSLYRTTGTSQEQRNAPARNKLEEYYHTRQWGASEFGTFQDYWNALLNLPGELIGDPSNEIRVNVNNDELIDQMNNALLNVLECQ